MASTKLRKYNAIPRGNDKKAVEALTKIAEILTGASGDKLEKALTLRDLEDLSLINIQRGINRQGGAFTNIVKSDVVTEADFPTKPVAFTVAGAYSNMLLAWNTPAYKGHSITEIYRSISDVLGGADFIGSTISSQYGDPVGTNSSYYYWIRHVNINGEKGPYNDTSGVFASTSPDVEYLLEQLTDQINTSELTLALRNDIDWISKPDGLRDTLFSADGLVQSVNTISTSINDPVTGLPVTNSLVNDVINLNISATSALAERFDSIEATANSSGDSNTAGINELKTALAYDNGAISISATDVFVTVNGGGQQGIQQFAEVTAQDAVDGSDVAALWAVKSTVGQLTAGFGLYNNGGTTTFAVSANSFQVINPVSGAGLVPFVVRTSNKYYNSNNVEVAGAGSSGYVYTIPAGVYMTTLFAMDGYFTNIVAGTINADYVNALDIDVSGKLTATGVDFNGGTFVIDINGAVTAKNITIQDSLGNIILDANEVDGTYIKNLSVDTLSIAGNAVTAIVSAFTATASANPTLQTIGITTVGGSVELVFQAYIGIVAAGGGGQSVYFNLYRDSTLLKTIEIRAQSDRSVYSTSIAIYVDTPPAGSYTYALTRTGYAANVTDRYLSAREFKK